MKRLGRPPKSLARSKPQQASVETVSSRVGGRERKAKKVFDPSENNTPKKRVKASKSSERSREESSESKYKQRSDSKSSSPKSKYSVEDYCSMCNKTEKKLKMLVNCNDCNLKTHVECLTTKFEDRKLLELKWRCDNCKTCAICYETEEIGTLITCSVCINSYHITCHVPKVNTKVVNYEDWRCTKCPLVSVSKQQQQQQKQQHQQQQQQPQQQQQQQQQNQQQQQYQQQQLVNNELHTKPSILKPNVTSVSNSNSSLTSENSSSSFSSINTQTTINKEFNNFKTTTSVKLTIKEEKIEDINTEPEAKQNIDSNQKIMEKLDLNDVPDISSWTCERLADFIQKIFPYEAELLREQDIDGQSLLLMTRADVLSLGLKLGPALRLYNFIVGLQTRKYDNFATWIY